MLAKYMALLNSSRLTPKLVQELNVQLSDHHVMMTKVGKPRAMKENKIQTTGCTTFFIERANLFAD